MQLLNSLTQWLAEFKKVSLKHSTDSNALPEASLSSSPALPALAIDLTIFELTDDQFVELKKNLTQYFLTCLAEAHIDSALDKWQKLYENFRLGLQLGLQTFSETLQEAREKPTEQNKVDELDPDTWISRSVSLLNYFDQHCADEIHSAFKTPEFFITQFMIENWLQETHQTTQLLGDDLLERTHLMAQEAINQRIQSLNNHLQMNSALEKFMADPGAIGLNFEMYLWARYIKAKRIGNYAGNLQGLLHITPRIAPQAPVVRRLADLRVLDNNTEQKHSDSRLKQLNEWAETQVTRLSVWDNIRDA